MADKIIPSVTVKEPFVEVMDSMRCMTLEFTWTPSTKMVGDPPVETPYLRKEIQLRVQHDNGTWSIAADEGNDIAASVRLKLKNAAEEYLAVVKPRMGF